MVEAYSCIYTEKERLRDSHEILRCDAVVNEKWIRCESTSAKTAYVIAVYGQQVRIEHVCCFFGICMKWIKEDER